jgi:hypothetical protein
MLRLFQCGWARGCIIVIFSLCFFCGSHMKIVSLVLVTGNLPVIFSLCVDSVTGTFFLLQCGIFFYVYMSTHCDR